MTQRIGQTGALRYSASVESRGGIAEGGSHWWLVRHVPPGSRVLDCGCAGGHVGRALGARDCLVEGIEIDGVAAAVAEPFYARVHVGSLEDPEFIEGITGNYDRIVLGDVLEHLIDPVAVLRRIVRLLTPDGRLLVSVPNIAHWSIRWSLLRGRFQYEDLGLLDRTHLRFFTFYSARDLAREAGLIVTAQEFTVSALPPIPFAEAIMSRLHHALPNLFAYQTLMELGRHEEEQGRK